MMIERLREISRGDVRWYSMGRKLPVSELDAQLLAEGLIAHDPQGWVVITMAGCRIARI